MTDADPDSLQSSFVETLAAWPPGDLYIAFSGGIDSSVLLHLAASTQHQHERAVRALHIDHQLHPDSSRWQEHCQRTADRVGVPMDTIRVDASALRGEGGEAAARHARYGALADAMGAGAILLTAHHRDDQAETVVLQLIRGGGVHGLAAMPSLRPFANGLHGRPLLSNPRRALLDYADEHSLSWVDDPSNSEVRHERNFIRHRILPQISERRPGVSTVLARSAEHFAEAAELLDTLAQQDLAACGVGENLDITDLQTLSRPRRHNLLRYWLRSKQLPLPEAKHLRQIERDLLGHTGNGLSKVSWPGCEVRRYRDQLYAMPPVTLPDSDTVLSWDIQSPLQLPAGAGWLHAEVVTGSGVQQALLSQQNLTVRFAVQGERCHPVGRGGGHSLKKLFQEAGTPPWERLQTPYIYLESRLIQVGQLCINEPLLVSGDEKGINLVWSGIEK